ncbi:hypothetical protein Q8F60_06120 [Streptococcus constellatus]|uniref:TcdA-E operon negative regulator n=1 Tax=Streptococcus constellatus subsp. constellatus SK53 TaxID=1095730 RepID=A0AAD2SVY8_STRCV|nr:hypothetical protein [Streptococcus constellatus]EID20554.1 hypothetical protein HMPREF1044_1057 [Streptococcus constellatus subsp. constellatus SK53]MDP1485638.1 hypothetical protein [Streptococcus constellatus]QQT04960.1 hypothetical protein I6J13_05795 [Streptococcus constellatus]SUN41284.1 Uncharacterised protein [Streptococcus constellatus]BBD23331.1 hypothetical protein SCSC_1673 [Streptococcus constellatus subsp. constellatus]
MLYLIIIFNIICFGVSLVFFVLSFSKRFNNFRWLSALGMLIASVLFFVLMANYINEVRTSSQTSETSSTTTESTTLSLDESSSDEAPTSKASYSSSSNTRAFDPNDYETPDFGVWNHDQLEKDKKVKIIGKILQNTKDEDMRYLRVAMDDDYDKVVMVGVHDYVYNAVIAENDNVTFYGMAKGLTSYKSTLGKEITLPFMYGHHYTVNSYGK